MVANAQTELQRLEVILNKKPIIGTWSAQDLIDHPEMVRENYLQHVRSFVTLNRVAGNDDMDVPTVEEYEKRLIRLVREAGAASGYVTGEFGYGKTSTALFVWKRCEDARIVAVPPFQIQKLHHLISASYGWIRYKLSVSYPNLVDEAERVYQKYVIRDIENHGENEEQRKALLKAYQEGRYSLELRPIDYIYYFEEMTALVRRANFEGLVIIADELQQYIESDIRAGDPITPLFDIIQALITRRGQLAFALIFSVPTKELGVINEQRGDLVQRLKDNRLALDLTAVYNQYFARDLWYHLARELQFEGICDRIIEKQTLESLGQIASRQDLANGPRTVVNAFNLIARRYKDNPDSATPYSPLDLVEAFLKAEISFDNTAKLQQVVNGQLAHQFVQNRPDYQKAIKLLAAFPVDGLPESYFDRYGVRESIAALTQEAQGDIVTYVGGSGFDASGQPREVRAMLVGMEERKVNTDWLTTTLREFVRNIPERSPRTRELTVKGFQYLLRQEVFKGWSLENSLDYTLTQNRAYIFKGSFNRTARRYPNRLIHIRILGEGEHLRDNLIKGDLAFNFVLELYTDKTEQERRYYPGEINYPTDKTISFKLNLNHNSGKENYGELHTTLLPLVSPWKITPALLLSLYAYLEEKRAANLIPVMEDEMVKNIFQPVLLEHAVNELFNAQIGQVLKAAGPIIVEEALVKQLEQHYSQYKTFMSNPRWKQDLREYYNALSSLPTPFIRQGQELYDKSKQEIASLFAKTPPSFETYKANIPLLLTIEAGKWRFTLHPLEAHIVELLKNSLLPAKLGVTSGSKPRNWVKREVAWKAAQELGYREEEFETALQLMETRGMISFNNARTEIIQETAKIPAVAELRESLKLYTDRLNVFKQALPEDVQINNLLAEVGSYQQLLEHLSKNADEGRQVGLATNFKNRNISLNNIIENERNRLAKNLAERAKKWTHSTLNVKSVEYPLEVGLFSIQLEAQRSTLQQEVENINKATEPLKQKMLELLDIVYQSPFADSDLLRLLTEEKRLSTTIFKQEEQQAKLNQWLGQYENARRLLGEGQRFEQRVQNASQIIKEAFASRLIDWNREVLADLSSQKLNGLSRESEWREKLNRLIAEFESTMEKGREAFLKTQTDYRNFAHANFPQIKLWVDIIYNQSEPQDSYNRLWGAVHEVFKQLIEEMRQQVQAVYDRAVRLQGGSLATLPSEERSTIQQTVLNILQKLEMYRNSTAAWVKQVAEPGFISRVREQGAITPAETMLRPVVNKLRKLLESLPEDDRAINNIEKRLKELELSPQEETLLATITSLTSDSETVGIELGLVLQQMISMENVNANEQAIGKQWELLAKLYAKGRLRIQVAPTVKTL